MFIERYDTHTVNRPGQTTRTLTTGWVTDQPGNVLYRFAWVKSSSTQTALKVSSADGLGFTLIAQKTKEGWTIRAKLSLGENRLDTAGRVLAASGDTDVRMPVELAECAVLDWVPNTRETHDFLGFCIQEFTDLVAMVLAPKIEQS